MKKIYYHSIVSNENQKESQDFCVLGDYQKAYGRHLITFVYKDYHYEIDYSENDVILNNGVGTIEMNRQTKTKSVYQLSGFTFDVEALLKGLKIKDNGVHILFELYQDHHFILKNYIQITFEEY